MMKFLVCGFAIFLLSSCGSDVKFQNNSLTAANGSLIGSPVSGAPGAPGTPAGSSSGTPASNPIPSCPLENVTRPIKLMFVVDTSGSNVSPTTSEGTVMCDPSSVTTCAPPTDPQKTFRAGSISTFFTTYQSKVNFSWGFEIFSGTSAQSYMTAPNLTANFGSAAAMQTAITQFSTEVDGGATPYIAALANAQNAIASDPDLGSKAVNPPLYYIIFMSDGYPTDALTVSGSVDFAMIGSAISGIQALAPGRVILSSVYYGAINDPIAAATLQNMATAGGGQFANVDTGSVNALVIDDLIQIPTGQCN